MSALTLALPQTEAEFMGAVVDYARIHDWLIYHTYRSTRSAPGFPDLVMVRGERVVFAELKAAKGRLTGPQMQWIVRLSRVKLAAPQHVDMRVWRPSDWLEIEEALGGRR